MNYLARLNTIQDSSVVVIREALLKNKKALIRGATGIGKTRIATKTISQLLEENPDLKVLWLTHRTELVDQAVENLQKIKEDLEVGVFKPSKKQFSQILVASIPLLSKIQNLKRFKKKHFDLIVVDECHHSPAETWRRIIEYFNADVLGLTATPYRPDGATITDYFGEIVVDINYRMAVEQKLIAADKAWLILTNSVLDGATTSKGEYKAASLGRLFESKDRNKIIVEAYKKYGRSTMKEIGLKYKSICFCINIEHAKRMKDLFNNDSVRSEILVGSRKYQTAKERQQVFDAFKHTHNIEILCVVDICNEGVDVPDIGCVVMARPTRSNIIYQQQIGRGCRIVDGLKFEYAILDFVDNTTREFQAYTLGNPKQVAQLKEKVITDWLEEKDDIAIQKRVKDVMFGVEAFENRVSKPINNWSKENCIKEAKKYTTKIEWLNNSPNSYQAAGRNNWLKDCTKHMKKIKRIIYGTWKNKERCIKDAQKYSTSTEWRKNSQSAYCSASFRGWLKYCTKHMKKIKIKPKNYWSKERCIKEAQKYLTITRWRENSMGSYLAACRHNWLKDCTAHMKRPTKK